MRQRTDVVVLGFGSVGRALVDQVSAMGDSRLAVVALLDRSGCLFDPDGLRRRRLRGLVDAKGRGCSLEDSGGRGEEASVALARMAEHGLSHPVLVDATAGETTGLLLRALGQGFDLALANKKPLAGSSRSYERLMSKATAAGRRVRFEATVGAGLPVLDTFRKLSETGDRVLRVEGSVSGTLTYVLSGVSDGHPFSETLRQAMSLGYTEPDPREDLGGQDALRKGTILARLMGYRGAVPRAESLVPPSLRRLPAAVFLEKLSSLDASWSARAERAGRRGRVLRYLVRATRAGVRAGLVAVPGAGPHGSLRGTTNLFAFTTRRYREQPLVVSGPGAGPEVTAAGILNDIQDLARG